MIGDVSIENWIFGTILLQQLTKTFNPHFWNTKKITSTFLWFSIKVQNSYLLHLSRKQQKIVFAAR
jgi:hypothetical protein